MDVGAETIIIQGAKCVLAAEHSIMCREINIQRSLPLKMQLSSFYFHSLSDSCF